MGMYLRPNKGESFDAFDLRSRKATDIDCTGDDIRTKQEFRDDADINVVIARCLKTGSLDALTAKVAPVFADVSEIGDYQTVVQRIQDAEDAFMLLPASVRTYFDNDSANAVAFIQNPANLDKAVELGLVGKRVEPKAVPVVPAVPEVKPPVVPA